MTYDDWLANEPDYLDPGHQRERLEREPPPECCDTCGNTLGPMGRLSISGVGVFCPHHLKPACSEAGVEKHRQRLERPLVRVD